MIDVNCDFVCEKVSDFDDFLVILQKSVFLDQQSCFDVRKTNL